MVNHQSRGLQKASRLPNPPTPAICSGYRIGLDAFSPILRLADVLYYYCVPCFWLFSSHDKNEP